MCVCVCVCVCVCLCSCLLVSCFVFVREGSLFCVCLVFGGVGGVVWCHIFACLTGWSLVLCLIFFFLIFFFFWGGGVGWLVVSFVFLLARGYVAGGGGGALSLNQIKTQVHRNVKTCVSPHTDNDNHTRLANR